MLWAEAVRRGAVADVGACEGRAERAAVRADNNIGAGAESLAPSLGRMTQLTSLDLHCTLRASAASWLCERVLSNAGNVVMLLRVVG